MGNRITSYLGQLSLAIHPWVGTKSTSDNMEVNTEQARCAIHFRGLTLLDEDGDGDKLYECK